MTLRKLLGAQAVATIPGRGCRFTAALDEGETAAAARPGDAPSGHDPPSIAVLPFLSIGGEPEQGYLADGVTEGIITDLSRWRSLAVTSRNSTFRFKDKAVDVRDVGRELGGRYVVEGSVRRMGERIRITAPLRRFAAALADFDRAAPLVTLPGLAVMAACCAKLGLADRTRDLVERCLARAPAATVGKLAAKIPFKDVADHEHLVECLRAAGFPR